MSYNLPTRRLVSQEDSAMIARPDVPRSVFTGTFTRKTAFDAGYLVPFMVDEILPGDHMTYEATAYVRMATPLFPLFDNQRVDTFFFFVPARLLWTNWQRFMGQQDTPSSTIDYVIPTLATTVGSPPAVGSIYDHMGIPVAGQIAAGESVEFNVLPLRAYNKIWNQWFRDQNSQSSLADLNTDSGDLITYFALQRRNKSHDYFTSALPWPQKFTAPTVPLGGFAPIVGLGSINDSAGVGPVNIYETLNATPVAYAAYKKAWVDPGVDANEGGIYMRMRTSGVLGPDVYADLSQATGVAINTLRQAWMVQSLLEQDARGGTRYTELIRSHFGVINPDFRLQRAEYIGGGQTPLNITPIAQTAPTTGVPLGALGAAGTAAGSHRASYAATEHGYILGLINVRSELSYQQGLHKLWQRRTRLDFYFPAMAGLGEQAILRSEIYCTGNNVDDATVFGYQERWHEYRTRYSDVTGIMRSTATGTIDAWHLAQNFGGTAPALSGTFLQDIPPMTRVLAAGSSANNQQYLADIMIHRRAVRPLPMFGTPSSLGRF